MPDSYAMTTNCVRSRAPSFKRIRLTWVRAVAGLMNNRSPISALVSPSATSSITSCSRSVSSLICVVCGGGLVWATNSATSRRVAPGDSKASPAATTRIARTRSAGSVCFTKNPVAPDRMASKTYSSSSNVVSTTTLTSANCGSDAIIRVAPRPSSIGMRMSINTTSGASSRVRRTAFSPLSASPTTSMPSCASNRATKPALTSAWSSATTTRTVTVPPRWIAKQQARRRWEAEPIPGSRRRDVGPRPVRRRVPLLSRSSLQCRSRRSHLSSACPIPHRRRSEAAGEIPRSGSTPLRPRPEHDAQRW